MRVLVTGAAGFIGSTLAKQLLSRGDEVLGVDNFNPYYSVEQKRNNVASLAKFGNFKLSEIDFTDFEALSDVFKNFQPDVVAHLGAMANIRYSIDHPEQFVNVNVTGTNNLLMLAAKHKAKNFVYASTGSIYGKREDVPFKETDICDSPLAVYPASKKAGELLGHAFYNMQGLNFTSLRFFNVYGPSGRPDMMPFRVTEAILNQTEIPIFGEGKLERDWTYVGDLVDGFVAAIDKPLGFEIINLGRGNPVVLNDFMTSIQEVIGQKAICKYVETPLSEAPRTYADISKAGELLCYKPKVDLKEGLEMFWEWYRSAKL